LLRIEMSYMSSRVLAVYKSEFIIEAADDAEHTW